MWFLISFSTPFVISDHVSFWSLYLSVAYANFFSETIFAVKTKFLWDFFFWGSGLSKLSLYQHAHRFFHLGVHVPFYLHFWGYKENELHFLHARSCTMLFFYKYYAKLAKTFVFCLTLGQTGSGVLSDPWSLCLSHHFFL